IAVGYTVSSSAMNPAIRYAARLATDPPGTLQTEAVLINGAGSQTGSNRWGDYAAMGIDPADDCTFWYTNEYYPVSSTNQWKTRVGVFNFPSCGGGGTPTPTPTPSLTPTPSQTPTPSVVPDNFLPLIRRDVPPTPTPTFTPTPPSGWVTIINEGFEGAFPGPWQLLDTYPGGGEYYWGQRDCLSNSGAFSGWAVGGGADGAGLPCGSNYPNNAQSRMIYGPFNLADAVAADLTFQLWQNSQPNYDFLCRSASINGSNFSGTCTSGASGGWIAQTLDLTNVPTLGNLTGQPAVWIALSFISNSNNNGAVGAYVDNIVLRKFVSTVGNAAPALPPAQPMTLPDSMTEFSSQFVLEP
ncbi:MAG: hypothetical protein L0332_08050, partial [Chloroflexi bacterium]|nr:hypothetical protein [Chloroflexota bacterium]MCI0648143.1 hypothetical protein [Chloroflexota bacterium]MCI0726658.1 hypothetical protein [Chloroflexota bacterium]